MVDLSAIEAELMALIGSTGYASTETGRIREQVPVNQMPARDIAAGQVTEDQQAGYVSYRVPVTLVIRTTGFQRATAEADLKAKMEAVKTAWAAQKGTSFDVLRNFSAQAADTAADGGKTIRVGVVTVTAYKN